MTVEYRPFLTREDIVNKYPPKEETFSVDYHGNERQPVTTSAFVSRDESGKILFIVPGSAKWVEKPKFLEKSGV